MKIHIAIGLLLVLTTLVIGQDDLVVEKSIGPKLYPPAARAVRATGSVSVEVEVDANDKVVGATAISGHPLLRSISSETARQWEFSKAANNDDKRNRITNLFFRYSLDSVRRIESSETAEEEKLENIFTATFSIDVNWVTVIPRLLLLRRKNGKIPKEMCLIHESEMVVETQKVRCNGEETSFETKAGRSISDVEGELFPYANVESFGPCGEDSIEQKEVYYCNHCRIKRNDWIRDNS